jgi:hypothetical protein
MIKPLTRREREKLRESFLPKRIRVLFIGEAPPASGRFFYSRNSGLYRAMRQAFEEVNPRIDDQNFLSVFRASGCYLTDLYPKPVDRLDSESRRRARIAGEKLLSQELIELRPHRIAPLLRAIAGHVTRAAARANWQGEITPLPYPGRWVHLRAEFGRAIAPILSDLFRSCAK